MGADVSAEYSSILCSWEERASVVVKQKKEGHNCSSPWKN